jgi:predicted metal-binding membrane protein
MTDAVLETVLRRDRAIVLVALAGLTATAWAYVLWLAFTMQMGDMSAGSSMSTPSNVPAMDMPGMKPNAGDAASMLAPVLAPWSLGYALFMFIMWAVMMVGMMTPSATPMVLIYARVGRQAAQQGKPFASTAWFASGYLASWIVFSILATGAQWGLERAALLTPMMASASPVFGGLVLIAAGLYQWTPLKDRCLSHCQAPLVFIQKHGGFRRDPRGALLLGLHHGSYCIGCCWALMALLFVGGVMNILWIALLAIFILAEKVIPAGKAIARVAGVALVLAGVAMVAIGVGG